MENKSVYPCIHLYLTNYDFFIANTFATLEYLKFPSFYNMFKDE